MRVSFPLLKCVSTFLCFSPVLLLSFCKFHTEPNCHLFLFCLILFVILFVVFCTHTSFLSGVPAGKIIEAMKRSIAEHTQQKTSTLSTSEQRKAALKHILLGLHNNSLTRAQAKDLFANQIGAVSHAEIAGIEQSLVEEGCVTTDQIAALCNIHAEVLADIDASDSLTNAPIKLVDSSGGVKHQKQHADVSEIEEDQSLHSLPRGHPGKPQIIAIFDVLYAFKKRP